MSFHLIGQPLPSTISLNPSQRAIYAKVLAGNLTIVVVITSSNDLVAFDIQNMMEICRLQLNYCGQKIQRKCVEVYQFGQQIWLMTREHIFWTDQDLIMKSVAGKVNNIQLNRLVLRSQSKELIKYGKLMNKQIKMVTYNGQRYVKLAGRSKDALFYYCGPLDPRSKEVLVSLEYQQAMSPLMTPSIQSSDLDMLVYHSFTSKSKPITCFLHEFIPSHNNTFKELSSEFQINHFCKNITVTHVFKISFGVICLFCNETYEERLSFMIVYNLRDRYTQNYLTFNRTTLSRIVLRQRDDRKEKVFFEAMEFSQQKTRYFLLNPESYLQKEDSILEGTLLSTDSDFLILQNSSSLSFHPKIPKKSLYSSFLRHLLPEMNETHTLILSLL